MANFLWNIIDMVNLRASCRKTKRRVNKIRKAYHVGSYVVSCNGHPSIVTEKDDFSFYNQRWALFEGSYKTKSLIDGREDSCSIFHCPLIEVSKTWAMELVNDMKNLSEYELNSKYQGKKYADKVKHWRETDEWVD